jgi:hypothetical protein
MRLRLLLFFCSFTAAYLPHRNSNGDLIDPYEAYEETLRDEPNGEQTDDSALEFTVEESPYSSPTPPVIVPRDTQEQERLDPQSGFLVYSINAEVEAPIVIPRPPSSPQNVDYTIQDRQAPCLASLPDDIDDFLHNSTYSELALKAEIPNGYTDAFVNATSSIASTTPSYLTYHDLSSYSSSDCASKCSAYTSQSGDHCISFDIYFQRTPVSDPTSACPDPQSDVVARCALYGEPISEAMATNEGQLSLQFQFLIAGSNGYNLVGHESASKQNPESITSSSATAASTYAASTTSSTAGSAAVAVSKAAGTVLDISNARLVGVVGLFSFVFVI